MSIAYQLVSKIHDDNKPIIYIANNASIAERLTQDLSFLLQGTGKRAAYLPNYELSLVDSLSPANAIIGKRLETLHNILHKNIRILIITVDTLCTLLPPKSFISSQVFSFKKQQQINLTSLKKTLANNGYSLTSNVSAPQQVAIRGAIIDLYPPAAKQPIRIELDDDIIDSLHYFDISSQRSSSETLDSIEITPSLEFLMSEIDFNHISTQYPNVDNGIITNLKSKRIPTGWHRYLPLLHHKLDTVFDYTSHDCHLYAAEDIASLVTSFMESVHTLVPGYLISANTISHITQHTKLLHDDHHTPEAIAINTKEDIKKLNKVLTKRRLLFVCQSYFRMHQLESTLLSHGLSFEHVGSWFAFTSKNIQLGICQGELSDEIHFHQQSIIPEQNLTDKVIIRDADQPSPSMHQDQMSIGDLLIHVDHGVGMFMGIETRTINQVSQDFVIIQYKGEDKLLFPPDQLFKIHPYHGTSQSLDELRSKSWAKRKEKALKNIEVYSAKLLRLQSNRQDKQVNPIPLPPEYSSFTDSFPFTETNDQINIMDAIISDFKQKSLFDRLVCGDVGFGKTEIAMRTAFIALMNGYQVAVIAPTTVLATQHFNNFKNRMALWNISMSLMSRSNKFTDTEGDAIANGDIQLVIGTHKLLTQKFSNLCLVIIDEEHRFGVTQKDSIQAFNKAHKLSLTATPIPRSLNMALSKLRQLSIMSTPPKQRLPILTFVEKENNNIVKQALEREINRGGQAYVVFNDVANIDQIHKKLDKLCPQITFGVVHGQMPVSAVEKQMARFHSQVFQVLIASTIIESGLDVANANTIIVYRADKLGLAQLHQIRGRVGRSHHQAYAYLLTPDAQLSPKAEMRLEAISQAMHLGAGYELSIADLEIRGSGNLLGEEQSGHVNAIGISYYTELLNQATSTVSAIETEIDLGLPTTIPNSYVTDTQTRYQFYHRIANASTTTQIENIGDELKDRFGKIPHDVEQLLQSSQLKIDANMLGICSIQSRNNDIIIDVGKSPKVNTNHLLHTIQSYSEYGFGGKHHIRIIESKHPVQDCQILLNRLNGNS